MFYLENCWKLRLLIPLCFISPILTFMIDDTRELKESIVCYRCWYFNFKQSVWVLLWTSCKSSVACVLVPTLWQSSRTSGYISPEEKFVPVIVIQSSPAWKDFSIYLGVQGSYEYDFNPYRTTSSWLKLRHQNHQCRTTLKRYQTSDASSLLVMLLPYSEYMRTRNAITDAIPDLLAASSKGLSNCCG